MKNSSMLLALLILIPVAGIAQDDASQNLAAQNFPGMSQMNMQKIQAMQECIASVDQKQLLAIEQQQKKFDAEMTSLCASNKRDQAQQAAMAYAKRMMNNPAIKAMQKCGEIAKGMMPDMPFSDINEDIDDQHICDTY